MPRIDQSERAREDLIDIWNYIAADSPTAADALLRRIAKKCASLADWPGLGRPRDELAPNLRSAVVGQYVIFYQQIADGIEVVRVVSGYRDLDSLFDEEQP